jgi:acid phosphatase
MTNDGHDTSLDFAATWSKNFLTPLLKNTYFTNRTLILLTYDESKTYSKPNKIVSILLGDAIPDKLKGTEDDTFYTHYSVLSTLENNFELPNLGRYDVGANVFDVVAKKTAYKNINIDKSKVDLSISYPGFLNSKDKLPLPYPNTLLQGAGGPIQKGIAETWGSKGSSPYDGSGNVFDKGNPPVYKPMAANALAKPLNAGEAVSTGSGMRWGRRGVAIVGIGVAMGFLVL